LSAYFLSVPWAAPFWDSCELSHWINPF
jgi:hypothetical protein